MAKLFYQVKEENFSAKISNWQHSRYCGKIQTILFSLLPSQHPYRKFDLFYLWDICACIVTWMQSFSTKLLKPSHGNFVGCIALKPLFNTLVFTLLYVKIPIQQIIHVLLTVGYKFVNDLENWFSLPWLWRHWKIWVTGRNSPIYKNSMPGSEQLCIEKLWLGWAISVLKWWSDVYHLLMSNIMVTGWERNAFLYELLHLLTNTS